MNQRKHYKTEPMQTEVTTLRCTFHGEPTTIETSALMDRLNPGNQDRDNLQYGCNYIVNVRQSEPSIQLYITVFDYIRSKQPKANLVYGSLSELLTDFTIVEQIFSR